MIGSARSTPIGGAGPGIECLRIRAGLKVNSKRPPLLRVLAFALSLAALSGAARAAGWVPIGPTDIGMVLDLAAGSSAIYAGTCNGVYRSEDRGSSWHEAGLQRECVVRVAADPRSDTIYAILDPRYFVSFYPEPRLLRGDFLPGATLWISRDGGQTWAQAPIDSAIAVALDVSEPETAYVSSYGSYYPLAVTHDAGATWSRVPDVPPDTITRLTVDPRDGTIYGVNAYGVIAGAQGAWSQLPLAAAVVAAGSGSDGAVYGAGVDGAPLDVFCRRTTASPEWSCNPGPSVYEGSILEVPGAGTEARRILVSGYFGVWSSDDGGVTWELVAGAPVGYTKALALDPSERFVYAGNDAGVHRSADRGHAWTNVSVGLRSTWIRAIALDPTEPSTIWAGAEGRRSDLSLGIPGLFRSTDSGESWTTSSGPGQPGSITALAIDPQDRLSLYASSWHSLARTRDGGASWSTVGTPRVSGVFGGFVFGLEKDPDPAFPGRVWIATDGVLAKSHDRGQNWFGTILQSVFCLHFDKKQPGTMYAGAAWRDGYMYGSPYGGGFSVHVSRNGGSTWTRSGSETGGAVLALATDPFSENVVYAGTFDGTILRSPDAGATWERWDTEYSGGRVLALLADPVRPGRLYIGGWGGVFRSVDGGRSWYPFSEGLAPYGVFGLAVSPNGRWLYAGTTGGGVFQRDLLTAGREARAVAG